MFKNQDEKLTLIQPDLIIAGIDVAKRNHYVQVLRSNGITIGKPFNIQNNRYGFECLVAKLEMLKQETGCRRIILGLEPTGHYWKPLTQYLREHSLTVVLVNPYHVKRSKELDDNTQTKSDPKDAKTIARLVKEGRFSEVYLPDDIYGELRILNNTRNQIRIKLITVRNILTAILDEYFPEFETVFKDLTGKTAQYMLHHYPFPKDLTGLGVAGIAREFKRAVLKGGLGLQKAQKLYEAASNSIGLFCNAAIKLKLQYYLDEYSFLTNQVSGIEVQLEQKLQETGISQYLLSIKGIGVVTAAAFLAEIGDPHRFLNWKQLRKLAGLNLVEDSSGEHKGKRVISKRGRPLLRCVLYRAALVVLSKNKEFKELYQYLITRKQNPLKKKQAAIFIAVKLLRVMFSLVKNQQFYDPERVLGEFRKDQLKAA